MKKTLLVHALAFVLAFGLMIVCRLAGKAASEKSSS